MNWSDLIDIGLATTIAWGAKRELDRFRAAMEDTTAAIRESLQALTTRVAVIERRMDYEDAESDTVYVVLDHEGPSN